MERLYLNHQCLKDEKGQVASWIQVFKLGKFQHRFDELVIDDQFFEEIVSNFNAYRERLKADSFVVPIDYNHAGLADGEEGKAAGWIQELEIRDTGLYAKVAWTKRATEFIRNDEFKYISPEFSVEGDVDEFGEEIDGAFLHAAALTNRPFLRGMESVMLKTENGRKLMIEKIGKHLGLKDVSEETIVKAIDSFNEERAKWSEITETLALKEGETLSDGVSRLIADRDEATKSVTTLKNEIKEIKQSEIEREARGSVEAAEKEGKLLPKQREWALSYAQENPEGFKAFIENAGKQVDFSTKGSGDTDDSDGDPIKGFENLVDKKSAEMNPEDPAKAYAEAWKIVRKENQKLAAQYQRATRAKRV